jgi:hypothetical protein
MATLTANISASVTEFSITGDTSDAETGQGYRIDDEVIVLREFVRTKATRRGPRNRNRWAVSRGQDGTTAASHLLGAEIFALNGAVATGVSLSEPEPFAGTGEGGGVTVDNTVDAPVAVTSIVAAGATFAGDEATLPVAVLRRTTVITHAQILTLHSTRVELVPDQGTNAVIDFLRIFVVSDITTAYGNIGASSYLELRVGATAVDISAYVNNNAVYDGGMLTALFTTDQAIGISPPIDVDETTTGSSQPTGAISVASLDGPLAIGLNNSGALTLGHADNVLKVTVIYTVVDL